MSIFLESCDKTHLLAPFYADGRLGDGSCGFPSPPNSDSLFVKKVLPVQAIRTLVSSPRISGVEYTSHCPSIDRIGTFAISFSLSLKSDTQAPPSRCLCNSMGTERFFFPSKFLPGSLPDSCFRFCLLRHFQSNGPLASCYACRKFQPKFRHLFLVRHANEKINLSLILHFVTFVETCPQSDSVFLSRYAEKLPIQPYYF